MVFDRLEDFAQNPLEAYDRKVLKGKFGDLERLRIGRFRVIFEITGQEMLIYEIIPRKDAYHD